jgi:hypothetical protein
MKLELLYNYIHSYNLNRELLENNEELISNLEVEDELEDNARKKFPKFSSVIRESYR